MQSNEVIIISHSGCIDGSVATWIIFDSLPRTCNVKIFYAKHRDLSLDVPYDEDYFTDKHIYILDYMYPAEVLKRLKFVTLTIIDHHESSIADIEQMKQMPNVYITFDTEYCASMLAWKLVNVDIDEPWFLRHVNDRDTGKFLLPNTRAVTNVMFHENIRSFSEFRGMVKMGPAKIRKFIERGKLYETANQTHLHKCRRMARYRTIDQHTVALIPTGLFSTDLTTVNINADYIFCWHYDIDDDLLIVRMRTNQENINLAKIAENFTNIKQGGGHRKAAAFRYRGTIKDFLEERNCKGFIHL
jgi:hypothetical protein